MARKLKRVPWGPPVTFVTSAYYITGGKHLIPFRDDISERDRRVRRVAKKDVVAEARFVAKLFGLTA